MDELTAEQQGEAQSPSPVASPLRFLFPILAIVAGMVLLGMMGNREQAWLDTLAWKDVLIVRSTATPPEGVHATRTRSIDASNFPNAVPVDLTENPLLPEVDLNLRERLTAVDLSEDDWKSILESGVPPAANSTEVVAGALCRRDTFTVGGHTFTVVGKIASGTPGLSFVYLCRNGEVVDEVMAEESESGWIDPAGQRQPEQLKLIEDENGSVVMPLAPISRNTSMLALAGIALIVYGGGIAQVRILRRLTHIPVVGWFVAAADEYRALFVFMHALCYGVYFSASLMAVGAPLQNLTLMILVSELFTQGDLAHIGEAYMSGSVIAAAWSTFWNNFVIQTFLYSILPSLLVPFIGVLKTALSLLLAGFVLSPIWTGYIGRMTFHTLTLSLECQAYIFAAFAVSAYVFYAVRGVLGGQGQFRSSVRVIISGTLLSALILIAAAVYEAITLIAWG